MKLTYKEKSYYVNHKKTFSQEKYVESNILESVFDFAYDMSFGNGHHRKCRTGGTLSRRNGEIFSNAFQGKLAEFAVYQKMVSAGLKGVIAPDLSVYGRGVWDDTDLEYESKKINIKSAAFFSNLLLLEQKDWDCEGTYIPNKGGFSSSVYDYFILVRIMPDIKKVLKSKRLFYLDNIEKERLLDAVRAEMWYYDFGGVASLKTLKHIISKEYILPKGALLNGKIKMDADNYYIQCGDLKGIEWLIKKVMSQNP